MDQKEENRFDELLRSKLGGLQQMPRGATWQAVQPALPLPRPGLWQRLLPYAMGLVMGVLLMLGLNQLTRPEASAPLAVAQPCPDAGAPSARTQAAPVTAPPATAAPTVASVPALSSAQAPAATYRAAVPGAGQQPHAAPAASKTAVAPGLAAIPAAAAASGTAAPEAANVTTPGLPAALPAMAGFWLAGYALDTAIQNSGAAATETQAARLQALLQEQALVLETLRHRHDSLARSFLPETASDSLPAAVAQADPAAPALPDLNKELLPPPGRWSAALLAGATTGWGTQLIGPDSVMARERGGYNISAEARLSHRLTDRFSLSTGLGMTTLHTEVKHTLDRERQRISYDSTTFFNYTISESIDTTFLIHQVMASRLEPILNSIGQLIGYDTIRYLRNDTTLQVIMSHDSLKTMQHTVTKRVENWRDHQEQLLRPEYRFFTVPVSAHYLLVNRNRWSLGLSVGTQLTFFRGGTRAVWRNERYVLEKISAKDGPFRPVSLAVQSGLELSYRLSARLSCQVAPTLRWWALTPCKQAASTRTFMPGGQMGISWSF